jgi:hypothetical protein
MARKWIQMFNDGQENVNDEAQRGHPSLVNDNLVHMVNKRVCEDRHFTISAPSPHFLQISRTPLYDTVRNHLGYR